MAIVDRVDQLLEIVPCVVLFQPPVRILDHGFIIANKVYMPSGKHDDVSKMWAKEISTTHDFVEKFATCDELHHYVYFCPAGPHLYE